VSGSNSHNAGDIQACAGQIDEKANTIRGLRIQIDNHRQTLAAHWGGSAHGSFQNVMSVFDAELNKVIGSLENIHEKLVDSRITYESNEQEQHQAVSAIDQALNAGV
jgi:ESAT-6 family protein